MNMGLWPWDNGEKPYWVNPENGFQWYLSKDLSKYCVNKGVDAVVFIVCAEKEDGTKDPRTRVLVDKTTNEGIYSSTNLEAMAVHIDMLSLVNDLKPKK